MRLWRICHVLSIIFYGLFVVLQANADPRHAVPFLWIGFGVVTPVFAVGLALTFTRWYRRAWPLVHMSYVLITGVGALVIAVLIDAQHRGLVLIGLVFCYLFGFAIIRLWFIYASIAGLILTVAFLALAPLLWGGAREALLIGALLVVGFDLLGMMIAYGQELTTRRYYLSSLRLQEERARVVAARDSLEQRVKERTLDLAEKNRSLEEAIDQRLQLERERAELMHQVQQAQRVESVGRLAGGIAHDFNNLLTVINSYATFAIEDLPPDHPMREDLLQILEAGNRASALTGQLLAFSRKQVCEPRILDLNEVIRKMDQMVRRLIGEQISLKLHLAPDLGLINADFGQLEQVIMNLVVNARDAVASHGEISIATRNVELGEQTALQVPWQAAGHHIALVVSDTGAGMTEEVQSHLFEPFFTTKEQGRGTGLGLATVYGIIKQSGGAITVKSGVGRGTTFTLYLPRVAGEAQGPLLEGDPGTLAGDETILIVEDAPAVRELTRRIVAGAGYRTITAADGAEALRYIEERSAEVDLLLTDVVMPQMNGRELAERLKRLQPGLRVLYMSGYPNDVISHHGVLEAHTQLIAKPFDARDLLSKIRSVLDAE